MNRIKIPQTRGLRKVAEDQEPSRKRPNGMARLEAAAEDSQNCPSAGQGRKADTVADGPNTTIVSRVAESRTNLIPHSPIKPRSQGLNVSRGPNEWSAMPSLKGGEGRRVGWRNAGKGQSPGNAASWKRGQQGGSASGGVGMDGRELGGKGRESAWSFEGERPGLYRCSGRVRGAGGRRQKRRGSTLSPKRCALYRTRQWDARRRQAVAGGRRAVQWELFAAPCLPSVLLLLY
jgi:hypothetical protein